MIVIGFTCTGTFQLWLNCAELRKKNGLGEPVHHADLLFRRYPDGARCHLPADHKDQRMYVSSSFTRLSASLLWFAVLIGHSRIHWIAGAFIIGWAGAGGLLQIKTSVCNTAVPENQRGTVTALVMIASSLCNYTILTASFQNGTIPCYDNEYHTDCHRRSLRTLCQCPLRENGCLWRKRRMKYLLIK